MDPMAPHQVTVTDTYEDCCATHSATNTLTIYKNHNPFNTDTEYYDSCNEKCPSFDRSKYLLPRGTFRDSLNGDFPETRKRKSPTATPCSSPTKHHSRDINNYGTQTERDYRNYDSEPEETRSPCCKCNQNESKQRDTAISPTPSPTTSRNSQKSDISKSKASDDEQQQIDEHKSQENNQQPCPYNTQYNNNTCVEDCMKETLSNCDFPVSEEDTCECNEAGHDGKVDFDDSNSTIRHSSTSVSGGKHKQKKRQCQPATGTSSMDKTHSQMSDHKSHSTLVGSSEKFECSKDGDGDGNSDQDNKVKQKQVTTFRYKWLNSWARCFKKPPSSDVDCKSAKKVHNSKDEGKGDDEKT